MKSHAVRIWPPGGTRPGHVAYATPLVRFATRQVRGGRRLICFTWFRSRKSLTPEQKIQAAATFVAEGEFLSAREKLLNSSPPSLKAMFVTRMNGVHCAVKRWADSSASGLSSKGNADARREEDSPIAKPR